MPLVEIDQNRLDKIVAEIAGNIGNLSPGSMEHDAASRLLLSNAAMVAFIIDQALEPAANDSVPGLPLPATP